MTTDKTLTPLARLLRHLLPSARSVYEAFKYSPGQSRDEEGKFSTGLSGRATFIPYPGRRSLVKNPATLGDIQSVLKPPPNTNYVTRMDSHQRRELIIASDNIAHAEIANAAYPDDPDGSTRFLDNSTHFTLQFDSDQTPKEVGFNVRYAGVIMGRNPSREEETAAMDNIYNTMSHLTNMGISEKTPVVIKMANNKPLETTLEKALALRIMLGWKYRSSQTRGAAGRFGSSLGSEGGGSPGGTP